MTNRTTIALLVLFVLLATGCGKPNQPAPQTPEPEPAAEVEDSVETRRCTFTHLKNRRSDLSDEKCKPIDACAKYLLNHRDYLRYF